MVISSLSPSTATLLQKTNKTDRQTEQETEQVGGWNQNLEAGWHFLPTCENPSPPNIFACSTCACACRPPATCLHARTPLLSGRKERRKKEGGERLLFSPLYHQSSVLKADSCILLASSALCLLYMCLALPFLPSMCSSVPCPSPYLALCLVPCLVCLALCHAPCLPLLWARASYLLFSPNIHPLFPPGSGQIINLSDSGTGREW